MHCPPDVIRVQKGDPALVVVDWEFCKGCGICANVCPKQCISMVEE
jgi:Pyruvate/2-oxoacid:ferredoxin oxidoreductase delta subunit